MEFKNNNKYCMDTFFLEHILCLVNQGYLGEVWELVKKEQIMIESYIYSLVKYNWDIKINNESNKIGDFEK